MPMMAIRMGSDLWVGTWDEVVGAMARTRRTWYRLDVVEKGQHCKVLDTYQ